MSEQAKYIFTNHKDETFAVLNAATALNAICIYSERTELEILAGIHDGLIVINEDMRIEYFNSSSWEPFGDYYERVKTLNSCYTDITEFFEVVEG